MGINTIRQPVYAIRNYKITRIYIFEFYRGKKVAGSIRKETWYFTKGLVRVQQSINCTPIFKGIKGKKNDWSILRFFRYVGTKLSTMILSFIISFSLQIKKYLRQLNVHTWIFSLMIIEFRSQKYAISLPWGFLCI